VKKHYKHTIIITQDIFLILTSTPEKPEQAQ